MRVIPTDGDIRAAAMMIEIGCDGGDVAASLGIPKRTLQRRLKILRAERRFRRFEQHAKDMLVMS